MSVIDDLKTQVVKDKDNLNKKIIKDLLDKKNIKDNVIVFLLLFYIIDFVLKTTKGDMNTKFKYELYIDDLLKILNIKYNLPFKDSKDIKIKKNIIEDLFKHNCLYLFNYLILTIHSFIDNKISPKDKFIYLFIKQAFNVFDGFIFTLKNK